MFSSAQLSKHCISTKAMPYIIEQIYLKQFTEFQSQCNRTDNTNVFTAVISPIQMFLFFIDCGLFFRSFLPCDDCPLSEANNTKRTMSVIYICIERGCFGIEAAKYDMNEKVRVMSSRTLHLHAYHIFPLCKRDMFLLYALPFSCLSVNIHQK